MTTRVWVVEYLSAGGWRELGDAAQAAGLLAQGLAMRDAMVADLARVDGCSVSVAACEPGPRAATPVLDLVARQAAQHDLVWLVAPETGGLLAAFQRAVGAQRWLGCSAATIALAASKKATLAHLHARGVATPLAFATAPQTTRWVVKPDDGAGCVDTHVHAHHGQAQADLAARAQAGAAATLEPWIEGEALSLSLLCAAQQAELLSVNRQCIARDAGGMLSYGGVRIGAVPRGDPRWPPLAALAARVARALPGLRGFVGIDLVWHAQHGPVLIEINPRLTCAYVGLSAALGRNIAAELVAAHGVREPELARDHP